jgi:peptidoglycan/LPS O-acetylase OafA/YrhL
MTDAFQANKSGERLTYLDGARGLASLIIVVSHLLSAWLPALAVGATDHRVGYLTKLAHTPLSALWAGDTAVMFFFVHSGYVLSNRFITSGDISALRAQAVKRVIRLAIPVAVAVLITGLLVSRHAMRNAAAAEISNSDWLAQFYQDGPRPGLWWSAFGGSIFRGSAWWIGPLWSIGVQFYGSLLVFGLVALFGNDRRRVLVFGLIIAWSLSAGSSRFGIYFAAICIGVCFLSLHRSTPLRTVITSPAAVWKRVAAVILMIYFAGWPDEESVGPWYSTLAQSARFMDTYLRPRAMAHTFAATLAFWLVTRTPLAQRFLNANLLQSLGRMSFSTYLMHWPILMSAGCWAFVQIAPRTHSLYLGVLIAGALTLSLTAAISWMFMRLVDQPAINLANRVALWWNPNPSAATLASTPASTPASTELNFVRTSLVGLKTDLPL